ncbi:conserved hypothetical protein [Tenacibaculum litopenaei]|jgi:hypothetical protein|uniref:IPExxxVDY family protein n=1 Tax=Tenacibaculum litopenaei TaxID=396016 RepID=UPI0038938677
MPVYELDMNEFGNCDCALIGIHTTLSDYKLAYLLNSTLGFLFTQAKYCLDIQFNTDTVASFSVFEYFNAERNCFLISNVDRKKQKTEGIELFTEKTVLKYLVPEKSKVDYFVKIEGDFEEHFIEELATTIKRLPQIITSYQIDVNTLKSKDFLIF